MHLLKVFIFLLATLSIVPASAQEVPDRIEHRFSSEPLWLGVSEVETPEGDLLLEELDAYPWHPFRRIAEPEAASGCLEVGPWHQLPPPDAAPNGSIRDLVQHSRSILEGPVLAVEHGFYLGFPGSLAAIEVSRLLKQDPEMPSTETVLLFYPRGDFEVGGYELCVVDDDLPEVPAVGDVLLVFQDSVAFSRGPIVFFPRDLPVFIERRDGSLEYPTTWAQRLGDIDLSSMGSLRTVTTDYLRSEAVQP